MNINPFNISFNTPQPQVSRAKVTYPNLAPLKHDTISFCALKKSQFTEADLAVVEKYKAPIQKFNSNEDLQNWANNLYETLSTKDFGGKDVKAKEKRKEIIDQWTEVLDKDTDLKPTKKFLILEGVTSNLKPTEDTLPPIYDEEILDKTISELDDRFKKDAKQPFNFLKLYQNNLKTKLLTDRNNEKFDTGWLVIPSEKNDPENFEENVKKLQSLSLDGWCTKSMSAKPYLANGDFHFYFEKGKPKLGILFKDDRIEEIQTQQNNSKIPQEYFDVIKKHIAEDNKYKLGFVVRENFDRAQSINTKIKKVQNKLGKDTIENADTEKILKHFSIGVKKAEDGSLIVSRYSQPTDEYTFADLGIDENKMFSRISVIEGNANFSKNNLRDVSNLKQVGGNVSIYDSILAIDDFKHVDIKGKISKFEPFKMF